MNIKPYISYLIFVTILVLGILYLYWSDIQPKHYSETEAEPNNEYPEEEGISSSWTSSHKLLAETPSKTGNQEKLSGDWLCRLSSQGREIQLVRPISSEITAEGSSFAEVG